MASGARGAAPSVLLETAPAGTVTGPEMLSSSQEGTTTTVAAAPPWRGGGADDTHHLAQFAGAWEFVCPWGLRTDNLAAGDSEVQESVCPGWQHVEHDTIIGNGLLVVPMYTVSTSREEQGGITMPGEQLEATVVAVSDLGLQQMRMAEAGGVAGDVSLEGGETRRPARCRFSSKRVAPAANVRNDADELVVCGGAATRPPRCRLCQLSAVLVQLLVAVAPERTKALAPSEA
eukprot:CAMPEP_0117576668 /NCGR_PEP_ID=MMETSP0784-20121206/62939_1 /TAXON_ID=39447 /ORGANISM="" /LENGTH=231 /DNA_ID=CAMNT_0005375973 /DNA_START=50 /DNA_END=745 /DNA_ORIENTATION=-